MLMFVCVCVQSNNGIQDTIKYLYINNRQSTKNTKYWPCTTENAISCTKSNVSFKHNCNTCRLIHDQYTLPT